jgi:hypothetical protein
MTSTCAWGYWEEDWFGGRFRCMFCESSLEPDDSGMVHIVGLYRARDGEVLSDINTFQEEIERREIVVIGEDGLVRVRAEVANQIAQAIARLPEIPDAKACDCVSAH